MAIYFYVQHSLLVIITIKTFNFIDKKWQKVNLQTKVYMIKFYLYKGVVDRCIPVTQPTTEAAVSFWQCMK